MAISEDSVTWLSASCNVISGSGRPERLGVLHKVTQPKEDVLRYVAAYFSKEVTG